MFLVRQKNETRGGSGLIFLGTVGLGVHTLGLGFFGLEKLTK
jgi:hypothetical protein